MDDFILVKKILDVLSESNNTDYIIIKCLDLLLSEMKYDRGYVYFLYEKFSNKKYFYESVSSEKCSRLKINNANDWEEYFYLVSESGEDIVCNDILALDTYDRLRKLMLRNQQKSIYLKPIYCESEIVGFVGADSCINYYNFTTFDRVIIDVFSLVCTNIALRMKQNYSLSEKNKNLLTLMDNLGGISYAVDIETNEILFANDELKKLFSKDIEGKICYEVFQNRNSICEFCTTNSILNDELNECYEFYSPTLDKTFLLSDRIIEICNGRKARFEIGIDITEKRKLQDSIIKDGEKLQTIISSIGSALIVINSDFIVTLVNEATEKFLKTKREEILDDYISNLFSIELNDCDLNQLLCTLSDSNESQIKIRAKITDRMNKSIPCDISISKIKNFNSITESGFVLVVSDLTEYYNKVNQIERLEKIDHKTGAISKSYFENSLIDDYVDDSIDMISIIISDVNGLKIVNDLISHQKGDELLCLVHDAIRSIVQSDIPVMRWGGDEFLVCIANIDAKETEEIIERFKGKINDLKFDLPISVSYGYSITNNTKSQDIYSAIHTAEDYLNRHKLLESSSNRSFIIDSMRKSLYERSHETEEHASRLWNICKMMADAMSLSLGLRDEIELLAQLHDIGKISISDSILLKPSSLTESEWKVMKTHSEAGYRLLKEIPGLSQIAYYVLCHHERWDGLGYPKGLSGEDIPLPSRIIAIADTFDAITQNRVYHSAEGLDVARDEIIRCSGKQFDPSLVKIFNDIYPDIEYDFDNNRI